LSESEEAILAFAARRETSASSVEPLAEPACGITGPALSDWSFAPGADGNMMAGFIGRTIPSADAISRIALVVSNDAATYLMKRPCDLAPDQISELVRLAAQEEYLEFWRKVRVKLADSRCAPPVEPPYNLNANRWSLYAAGTTYFLPIADLTFFYINALLELFNEDSGFFPLDERNMFLPAGVGRFARSKGGHLEDDPRKLKCLFIEALEKNVSELLAVEIGAALQNLGLACDALGLGGFPHYTSHDIAWFQALGFRMGELPLTHFLHVPTLAAWILRLRDWDIRSGNDTIGSRPISRPSTR
jgi:hypothetical protein